VIKLNKQAERAGVRDVSPKGRDAAGCGSVHDSPPPTAALHYRSPASTNLKEAEMTHDQLRKLESARRKALREIASSFQVIRR